MTFGGCTIPAVDMFDILKGECCGCAVSPELEGEAEDDGAWVAALPAKKLAIELAPFVGLYGWKLNYNKEQETDSILKEREKMR